jgi:hypothetical protein
MVQKKKRKGRPFITVRLDPARLSVLRESAELLRVTVAEAARAMIYAEQDDPRGEAIRAYLGAFKGQLALPLDAPAVAQKPARKARSARKRGRRPLRV